MRKYRGVHHRKNRYCSVIWNIHTRRLLWLGSYKTPEEAAYAWDAAARLTRGHWAKTNFPEPAWARAVVPAPEVSTELVLALPTPAAAPKRRDPAAAVAAQVSFDNWLLSSSAARPPFSHLAGPTTAAAANNGGAAVVNPSNPGTYVLTTQNVQMPPTNPASTAVSSSSEPVVLASQFLSAAAPTQHRELPVSQASVSDLAVVGDNFTYDGAASSSSAPPPVPRLALDLLLQLLGRGLAAARVGRSKERQKLPQVPTGC